MTSPVSNDGVGDGGAPEDGALPPGDAGCFCHATDGGAGNAVVIASGQTFSTWGASWGPPLVVDDLAIYWATSQAVVSAKKTGGAPTTLAAVMADCWVYDLAVDAANVYFVDGCGGAIRSVSKNGGGLMTLVPDGALRIAVDEMNLYWIAHNDVAKRSKSDGTVSQLMHGPFENTAIAVHGTKIYYASGYIEYSGLYSIDQTGGAFTKIGEIGNRWSFAIDGSTAFCVLSTFSSPCDVSDYIRSLALAQDSTEHAVISLDDDLDYRLAVDDQDIYFANKTRGEIMKVPKQGGTPKTLVSGQCKPWGIAIDSSHIYWANGHGEVLKASR